MARYCRGPSAPTEANGLVAAYELVLDDALVERAGRSIPRAPLALAAVGSVVARRASPTLEATQRLRPHSGLRFSRKARMPSCASGSWLVAAITSTA